MNDSLLKRAAIAIALGLIFNAAPGVSQAQRIISYQGLVTDATNAPLIGLHALTLRIYTADTGGAPIFEELQKVTFSSEGIFNVLIGNSKPLLPLKVTNPATDRYYLGVLVDGSPELVPRSPLSDVPSAFFADTAGFARNASYADTAAFARAIDPSSLNIVPTTVNGLSNAVILTGGGFTTVSKSGDTIAITSSEPPAIQDLMNFDGILTILAPTGPATAITITDSGITTAKLAGGSVTTAKLANGAVTNAKLSSGAVTFDKVASGASTAGLVLAADGAGGSLWQSATASAISLPYTGTASTSSPIFSLINTGTGEAGYFQINSAANAAVAALQATTNGIGSAGAFSITNNASSAIALSTATNGSGASLNATTTGTGSAGVFSITNNASSAIALSISTNGSGASLNATTTGTGSAGVFSITNNASSAIALSTATNGSGASLNATTTGTGSAGVFSVTNNANSAVGLSTSTNGSGASLNATTTGTSNAGVFSVTNNANGAVGLSTSTNGSGASLNATTTGTGSAGAFIVTNAANAANGLTSSTNGSGISVAASTTGTGGAGSFTVSNAANTANALSGTTNGTGSAGLFQITNATSAANALQATTGSNSNSASAVFGRATNVNGGAYGVWGEGDGAGADAIVGFATNASGAGVGLYGLSEGTTGVGLYAEADGSGGTGVYGFVPSSASGYGVKGANNSTTGVAVLGLDSSSNYAVWGYNKWTGIAVYGQAASTTTTCTGVEGTGYWGVQGYTTFPGGFGMLGSASGSTGYGVLGMTGSTTGPGTGVYAYVGNATFSTPPPSIGRSNALIADYGGTGTSTVTDSNIAIFCKGATREFRFANNGQAYTVAGGAWNSGGADLAESFNVVGAKSEYESGDVLVLDAQATYHVAKCSTPYSKCVAGVYATAPGVLLGFDGMSGDTAANNAKVPMGVIGVIPTKVSGENGPIEVGDLLVTSSIPGHAMKGDPDKLRFGNILGKAMEPFNASGTGVIKVLVGKY